MRIGWLGVGLAAILWGTAGFAGKILTTAYQMEPLAVGAWRLLISVPFLLFAAGWERRRMGKASVLGRSSLLLLVFFGVAVAGYQISYFTAVDRTMVSTATLLAICSAPLLVSLVAHHFLDEKIGGRVVMALACGVVGTILLIGLGSLEGIANPRFLWGNLLALLAACFYGGYTLIGKKLLAVMPPLRMIAGAFSLAALVVFPFLRWPEPRFEAWLLLIYLGVIPTAFAYFLYSYGLARTTAIRASIAALLEPLTATVLATTLLGEWLSPSAWVGATLLLATLVLLTLPEKE